MTDTPLRRHLAAQTVNTPVMPRSAAHAASQLSRDLYLIDKHVRAVAAWFSQNGDPFTAQDAEAFTRDIARHLETIAPAAMRTTVAELVARIVTASEEIKGRLDAAAREDAR